MNPAVSIGIALSSSGSNMWEFIPYGLVELTSAGFAVALFKITQPSEYDDVKAKPAATAGAERTSDADKMEVGLDNIEVTEDDFAHPESLKDSSAKKAADKITPAPEKVGATPSLKLKGGLSRCLSFIF